MWKTKTKKGAKNMDYFNMHGKVIRIRVFMDYAVSMDNVDIDNAVLKI